MRTFLAALTTAALLAVAAPANAATVYRVEGTRHLGFKVWFDNGTNSIYPSQRRMQYLCNNEHGINTQAAADCRAKFRSLYDGFVVIRDSAETPDYWPFDPIPAPTS